MRHNHHEGKEATGASDFLQDRHEERMKRENERITDPVNNVSEHHFFSRKREILLNSLS